MFIKQIIDKADVSILITRPRRWGKSMNINMLKTFLELEVDENGHYEESKVNSNRIIFEGGIENNERFKPLKISEVDNGRYIKEH